MENGENANRRLLEACGGRKEIVRTLLRRGADPNARNRDEKRPESFLLNYPEEDPSLDMLDAAREARTLAAVIAETRPAERIENAEPAEAPARRRRIKPTDSGHPCRSSRPALLRLFRSGRG